MNELPTWSEAEAGEAQSQQDRAAKAHRRSQFRHTIQDWSGHIDKVEIEPKYTSQGKTIQTVQTYVSKLTVQRAVAPYYGETATFEMFLPDRPTTGTELAHSTRSATELDPSIQRWSDLVGRDVVVKEDTFPGRERQFGVWTDSPQEFYRVVEISGAGKPATNGTAPAQQNVDALLAWMTGKTPEEFNAGAHKYLAEQKIADTALTNKVAFGKFAPEMLAEGKVRLEEGKYVLV